MTHDILRRWLARCLVAVVLVPVALSVVLGLGGLLAALGDTAAAAVCGRVALGVGVLFVVALVAATSLNALAVLLPPRRRKRRRRRGRRPSGDGAADRSPGPLG